MGIIQTIKSMHSCEKDEVPEMGPGDIPEEAIPNGVEYGAQ